MATYLLRHMKMTDIEQVSEIERLSFSAPWSPMTYAYEINQNHNSYMGVIELPYQPTPPTKAKGLQLFLRALKQSKSSVSSNTIVAYGGLWVRAGEAHISTIASHPNHRGKKLGELMLVAMIVQGLVLKSSRVVLEVRVSNTVAQNLYHKYGFVRTGVMPKYYHDNREDAYVMTIEPVDKAYSEKLKANLAALCQQVSFQDTYTGHHLERFGSE